MKHTIEEIIDMADRKIGLWMYLKLINEDVLKSLGTGHYIVYRYLQNEDICEELMTFDDKDDAKAYADRMVSEFCTDDDIREWNEIEGYRVRRGFDTEEQLEKERIKMFEYFDRISAWDLPIRRGQSITFMRTVGSADVRTFIECLPVEKAKYFLALVFDNAIIPGFTQNIDCV